MHNFSENEVLESRIGYWESSQSFLSLLDLWPMANPETSSHAGEKPKMARFRAALNLDERLNSGRQGNYEQTWQSVLLLQCIKDNRPLLLCVFMTTTVKRGWQKQPESSKRSKYVLFYWIRWGFLDTLSLSVIRLYNNIILNKIINLI